ncbi:Ragulator complex LAMTOR3, partial [Brachionus plicatilis]
MSDEKIVFLKNNLSLLDANGAHDILLFQNRQYWFKEHNLKSNTTRYVCCQKAKNKCFASITIRNSEHTIARLNDNHSCSNILNDAKIATKKAEQELKYNVLSNKSKSIRECYNEAQSDLLTQGVPERAIVTLNPTKVMADFEKASTNAMVYHFPNVTIKGCWFHFKKAIFKHAVRIGLKQHYGKTEYNVFVNMFGALALVPIDKVQVGLEILKSVQPADAKCTQLLDYFEKQWIKKISPKVWNHFDSVTRTNNKVEGYHSAINKLVRVAHPNLFDIIDFIKSQQVSTYLNYLRLKQGTFTKKQSKEDYEKDMIYSLLKMEFSSTNDFQEYFHGISYHIRYPYEKIFEVDDSDDDFIESNSYLSASDQTTFPELNFESEAVVESYSCISVAPIQPIQPVTSLTDALGEANQVLYANSENIDDNSCVEPSISNLKPSTNPRIPLHQILAQCTNESDSDEEFDYINSLKNNQVLEKMREEKHREKASLESNISKRLVELTQDAINNEI